MLAIPFLLVSAALSAEPTQPQVELLKTFREEFIPVAPGEGKFPAQFSFGDDAAKLDDYGWHHARRRLDLMRPTRQANCRADSETPPG